MKRLTIFSVVLAAMAISGCVSDEAYEAYRQERLLEMRELAEKIESGECRYIDRTGSRARQVLVCDGANAQARERAASGAADAVRRLQNSGNLCSGGQNCGSSG